jgi:beta-glucanase (GH16 family)
MKQIYIVFASMFISACLFGCSGIVDVNSPAARTVFPEDFATISPTSSPVATPTPTPVATLSPLPTLGPPDGYALHFADEFDAELIDESVWGFEIGPWPYNNELECYLSENASIEEGYLVIEARKESMQGREYTSARLTTQGKLDMTYGYLEVRAALPTGIGTWSAIWLLPSDLRYGGYLHSGEIDMVERVGYDAKRVHSTIHTFSNNSVKGNAITAFTRLGRKDDDFHVYGLLWNEDALYLSFDGIKMLTYLRSEDATPDSWPFDVSFHLILNLAVGGSWGGIKGVDDEAFPQRMLIDYVRYYLPESTSTIAE